MAQPTGLVQLLPPGGGRQTRIENHQTPDEVGRIRVVKTESKGKANKRMRIRLVEP